MDSSRQAEGVEGTGVEGRGGQGRVPDCLGGLSRVGISSRSTRPWNGQPPSVLLKVEQEITTFARVRARGVSPVVQCSVGRAITR